MEHRIKFVHFSLGDGVTAVSAPMGEKIYVIEGKHRAMVIDTGMGIGSLKECIDEFCTLPLIAANTHGHPDHAGGNAEFEKVYLHPEDKALYYQMVTRRFRTSDVEKIFGEEGEIYIKNMLDMSENIKPLSEGNVFDLGGRTITVYKIEGHTKGSVVFYDSLTKWLFVGDAISLQDTWVYLDYSTSLVRYRNSLLNFIMKRLEIRKILSGHEPNEAAPELLNIRLDCLNKIIFGELEGEDITTFAGSGKRVEYKGTSLIYNDKRIKDD